tara:strand:- start:62 stop:178 length:117 start_codon:yes stop_codon:yes gene_type:complete
MYKKNLIKKTKYNIPDILISATFLSKELYVVGGEIVSL